MRALVASRLAHRVLSDGFPRAQGYWPFEVVVDGLRENLALRLPNQDDNNTI